MKKSRAILVLLLLALAVTSRAQSTGALTPLDAYSNPDWRKLAQKYQAELTDVHQKISSRYGRDQLSFITTGQAPVGGVGFWPNPVGANPGNRYLSVFMMVKVPPPTTGRPFADDQTGRVLTIWDAYGKFIMQVMAEKLNQMPEADIAGANIVFIYGKQELSSPNFMADGEAFALFMPRASVLLYAQHRMTNQSLFQQSEMFGIMQGADQINTFFFVFQP